jgi:hypothetical protein
MGRDSLSLIPNVTHPNNSATQDDMLSATRADSRQSALSSSCSTPTPSGTHRSGAALRCAACAEEDSGCFYRKDGASHVLSTSPQHQAEQRGPLLSLLRPPLCTRSSRTWSPMDRVFRGFRRQVGSSQLVGRPDNTAEGRLNWVTGPSLYPLFMEGQADEA